MRLIARFAQEKEDFFEIITVYDENTIKERLSKDTPSLLSIAHAYPSAVWFERKIRDDFGIEILYSNDERPLVKHEHFPPNVFPMRKDFLNTVIEHEKVNELGIDENHGVVTDCAHPFHLESSQFQVFDKDETILHFEMMTFYKYRGIEKMLEGLTLEEARPIVERIAASSTIAYQTAFLDIELQSSKKTLPKKIKKRHMFLLELERTINHLTDLSVLCQLLNFEDGTAFFVKFVGEGREVMKKVTGHRFGFSSLLVDVKFLNMDDAYDFLLRLGKELIAFVAWVEKNDKILLETLLVGQISKSKAVDYGLVGIMARCSGIRLDRRDESDFHTKHDFHMSLEEGGDTFSRFNIRITEILTSLRMMRSLVSNDILTFYIGTPVDGEYYSYVESSAGELMMYISLKDGVIERFFVRDPSFLNAQALPSTIKNSEVSTLGLIIKSIPFNISAIDL
ncbi:MAG: Hydrogenase, group 4, HycE subunit, putative [uncultured Sulfurovum sp.]|uniref:Hydrogenase, group 4, HycE subunit, putative n=1 Tax=uncultured Sulfurovum sp. TaxID=269237 RepID=A0A6S6S4T7_9BACT|nr:MAG: Hydrogenase, group 4, HycE subunit, putative [uncultured Sulfurovum sp.]